MIKKALKFLVAITLTVLIYIGIALALTSGDYPNYSSSELQERGARAATPDEQRALGIRTDTDENNMSQTGTYNVQIDPPIRADYERRHH